MTRHNTAMLVCRGLAIYIFFEAMFLLEIVAAGGRQLFKDWGQANKMVDTVAIFVSSFVPFLGAMAFALLLWFKAARVARRMVRGMEQDDEEAKFQLDEWQVKAVVLFALGAFLTAQALPQAGLVIARYWLSYQTPEQALGEIIRVNLTPAAVQSALQMVVGVTLLAMAWFRSRPSAGQIQPE